MNATMRCMTLQDILKKHGITELRAFIERAGLSSRQQAWSLWHGEAGVGKVMAQRLHERLKIPIVELIMVDPVPYTGGQFVAIPEFQSIGTTVGQLFAAVVAGQSSVDDALAQAQSVTAREMRRAGY